MAEQSGQAVVYIIDDEPSVQRALSRLMRSAGFAGTAFSSVDDFMRADIEEGNACIVADVHMPGTSALDLPGQLEQRGLRIPVIFITARDTTDTRERVQLAGAAGYFRKPVDDQALLDSIHWAISAYRRPH